MADQSWACKQLPNGMNPIVVCERETLRAELERLRAENDELRRRLAEGFATSVVIDVSHEDAARKLRQVMRTIEALTEGTEQ